MVGYISNDITRMMPLVVAEIKDEIGDRPVIFGLTDYSGGERFQEWISHIKNAGIENVRYRLVQDGKTNDNYRPHLKVLDDETGLCVTNLDDDGIYPTGNVELNPFTDKAVYIGFDSKISKTRGHKAGGSSMRGTLGFGIFIPGIEKAYTMANIDERGVINFTPVADYRKFLGPEWDLKIARGLTEKAGKERIRLISDHRPIATFDKEVTPQDLLLNMREEITRRRKTPEPDKGIMKDLRDTESS